MKTVSTRHRLLVSAAIVLLVCCGIACKTPYAVINIGLSATIRDNSAKETPLQTTLFVDDFDVLNGLDNSNVVVQKEGSMQYTTVGDAQWLSTPSDMIQGFMVEYLSHRLRVVHVQDPKPDYIVSGKVTQLALYAGGNKKIDSVQVGVHLVLQRYDAKGEAYSTTFSQVVTSKKIGVSSYTTTDISSALSLAFKEIGDSILEKTQR